MEPTEVALREVTLLLLAAKQKGVKSFAASSRTGKKQTNKKLRRKVQDSVWPLGQNLMTWASLRLTSNQSGCVNVCMFLSPSWEVTRITWEAIRNFFFFPLNDSF